MEVNLLGPWSTFVTWSSPPGKSMTSNSSNLIGVVQKGCGTMEPVERWTRLPNVVRVGRPGRAGSLWGRSSGHRERLSFCILIVYPLPPPGRFLGDSCSLRNVWRFSAIVGMAWSNLPGGHRG
jgi:hypothetical protein